MPQPSTFRIYQRVKQFQQVAIQISANNLDWVDTYLHPGVLGTRPVACGWNAKVAFDPSSETPDSFKSRIGDIRVRFVPDAMMDLNRRGFVFVDKQNRIPILSPNQELRISGIDTTWIRFPYTPGRIEVRLAGAKASDEGTVRPWFYCSVEAPDDTFLSGKVERVNIVDADLAGLPPLPPLPDPEV